MSCFEGMKSWMRCSFGDLEAVDSFMEAQEEVFFLNLIFSTNFFEFFVLLTPVFGSGFN